ncbi:MAG: hypothetical protein M1379_12550, partial [Firmicutes bacterium]|nr:hypothetical protein [Bacillota bacterium]
GGGAPVENGSGVGVEVVVGATCATNQEIADAANSLGAAADPGAAGQGAADRGAAYEPERGFVTEATVSTALGIFAEMGLIGRSREGGERRIFLFAPPEKKLDLESSIRYNEGVREREEFEAFQRFVLTADANVLLGLVNRPIYPENLIEVEKHGSGREDPGGPGFPEERDWLQRHYDLAQGS